jgi:threonine/homoserine/homoserine lactone efflux protein
VSPLAAAPIDGAQLAPFLLAAVLMELTPGPNMAYLSLVSLRLGPKAGYVTVLGITLGLAVCLVASVTGLASFAAARPWAFHVLRWGGVAYLLWLALDAWRGETRLPAGAVSRNASPGRLLLRGFLTNVLNPKTAVFYLSLLPGFIQPERGRLVLQGLTLGGLHLAIALAAHCSFVAVAVAAQPLLLRRAAPRAVRAGFAASLVGVALWVGLSTRAP